MTNWTQGKWKRVCILTGMILVLASSFLTFEWSQYYFGLVRISDPELIYSRLAKTLTSLLIFLLALSVGDDGIDASDPKRLRWSFIAMFAGDLLFLLDEVNPLFDLAAVLMFLLGHLFIIFRNGHGFRDYLRGPVTAKQRTADIVFGILILVLTYLLFRFTLLEHLRGSPLLYVLAVYAVVLDVSLWVGWASLRIGYFPKVNAILIAAGATCFFVGDYLVGFNLSLEPSIQRATTVFMTWIFYTPAILLFALSGYRWDGSHTVESET
jgi:hypothetical protein